MLRLTDVSKTFFAGTPNERRALRHIDLHLHRGDFATVIGSNGAGKSTLLNIIAGSLPVDSGDVQIDGHSVTGVPDYRRAGRIGRVFQDPAAGTAPHLTIEENLAVAESRGRRRGLGIGVTRSRRRRFAQQLTMLELGLEHRMRHRVGLLSGGQRQALSLLMASFTRPELLLLDEHTAALDPQRAELVLRITERVVADGGLTALMVTHNMDQALRMGNRLLMMHEGEIVFQLDEADKKSATVADLLDLFGKVKGQLTDRTLLG
jgi:putative ABC transport system ATP-binding protein